MTIINDVPMELCRLPALQLTEYTGKQPTNGSYGMFLFLFFTSEMHQCVRVRACGSTQWMCHNLIVDNELR